MKIKKGEIWKVRSRGFDGIIKVLKDIETEEDDFFDAEIIKGVKTYLNRDSEEKGSVVSFRTNLTDFIKRTEEDLK